MKPTIPENERDRLAALRRYELLDTPPEPVFDRIARIAAKLFKTPIATITLIDEHRQWFKAKVGVDGTENAREESFCAHAINQNDLFVVEDASRHPLFRDNPLVVGPPDIRFYAGATLVTPDGFALGAICVIDSKPRPPLSPDEEEVLRDLARMAMVQIQTRQALGYIDPVTGLANRLKLLEDIEAALKTREHGHETLVVIAIDTAEPHRHAELVRALGYTYADAFSAAAAARLRAILPEASKLYSISQFGFATLVSPARAEELDELLKHLVGGLNEPILCLDIPIALEGAVGVARWPEDAANALELLRASITATSDARDRTVVLSRFEIQSDHAHKRAFRLLNDLRSALAGTDQLTVVFQPKVDLGTGACVGAEALVRWDHPELGSISPGEFIPLAESAAALIRPLTDFVIEAVVAQITSWQEKGISLKVAVNVSMLDLEDEGFPTRLSERLGRYSVLPAAVEIEVTESALVRKPESARRQLNALQRLGVSIAIDDFGTGQSTHAYLKQIPATVLKKDQSFIRNLEADARDQAIVRSIIDLAHTLGYKVVAEGVESSAASEWLIRAECDEAQGYYYSRPLPSAAFLQWLVALHCAPVEIDSGIVQ